MNTELSLRLRFTRFAFRSGLFATMLLALPTFVAGQQSEQGHRIGVLMVGSSETSGGYLETLRGALRTLGYDDGRRISIEVRYASSDYRRLPALANELADSKIRLFVASTEQGLLAAKSVPYRIPIVVVACDPLSKLLGSLARPGGSATGVTCVASDLVGKRLGYLKSLVPDLKRVALLYHAQDDIEMEVRGAEAAADILGISIDRFPVRSADDFASAFDTMVQRGSKAIHISASGFTNFHRKALAELSMSHRLPSINAFPEYPEAGGLISYGATLTDGWKRAAYFVDRIIKGASPSDLPAEEPTKFYLTINQRIATNLGITIPDIILIQADKIIE